MTADVESPLCSCSHHHRARRIALTGGPGAGKTAVLETLRRALCEHVHVLPESAGILFGGGFPRGGGIALRRAGQRAIYFVQRELEATASAVDAAIVMCDRGTVDSLAYWPGPDDLWASVGSSHEQELQRYHTVIHLRTPAADLGYDRSNPLRLENAEEAALIDSRIAVAWAPHPRRFEIAATADFVTKVGRALAIVAAELPACCRRPISTRYPSKSTATSGFEEA